MALLAFAAFISKCGHGHMLDKIAITEQVAYKKAFSNQELMYLAVISVLLDAPGS